MNSASNNKGIPEIDFSAKKRIKPNKIGGSLWIGLSVLAFAPVFLAKFLFVKGIFLTLGIFVLIIGIRQLWASFVYDSTHGEIDAVVLGRRKDALQSDRGTDLTHIIQFETQEETFNLKVGARDSTLIGRTPIGDRITIRYATSNPRIVLLEDEYS
jgi:hypothetical protein